MYVYVYSTILQTIKTYLESLLLSNTHIESQKGTITIQRCSFENQKGIIAIDIGQLSMEHLWIVDSALLAHTWYDLVSQSLQTSQLFAYKILNLSLLLQFYIF